MSLQQQIQQEMQAEEKSIKLSMLSLENGLKLINLTNVYTPVPKALVYLFLFVQI